ncbi:MAG: PqqD family peptide modification chaperone [Burkholderiales bacterium]
MSLCFVFTPAKPKLYTLNASAWLVLSLCDGRSGRTIGDRYAAALAQKLPRDEAIAEAEAALRDLERKGIVARLAKRARRPGGSGTVQRERREQA